MHLRMFSLPEMRAWEPVLRKEYGSAGQGPKGSGRAGPEGVGQGRAQQGKAENFYGEWN